MVGPLVGGGPDARAMAMGFMYACTTTNRENALNEDFVELSCSKGGNCSETLLPRGSSSATKLLAYEYGTTVNGC